MKDTTRYLDRDISWLSFNSRVLDEAGKNIPLSERLMFLGIAHSNLEEFFMVRYPARLDNVLDIEYSTSEDIRGLAYDQYKEINTKFDELNDDQHLIVRVKDIRNTNVLKYLDTYFKKNIYPVLQPITINNRKIHPKLKTINFLIETFDKTGTAYYNDLVIPNGLTRFILVEELNGYVPIEDVIERNLQALFTEMKIGGRCVYTVLRNAEVMVTDDALDQYEIIEKFLKERDKSWITRIEVDSESSKSFIKTLESHLNVSENTLIVQNDLIALSGLKSIGDETLSDSDKFRKLKQSNPFNKSISIFDTIRERDRLVFHPFESFNDSFVRFVREAAEDDDVLSIKTTLYRVAEKSKIIDALLRAAERGKSVTVLVELKARFDEKHNLIISRILKESGINIVYGHEELKTHCKICVITRREKNKIRIYSHVGTGNYNEMNAKIYTDYSYFTADQDIGRDLTGFYNLLTSTQYEFKSKELIYAPHNMRKEINQHIEEEIKFAKRGKAARIIAKCNSLTDDKIADKLYEASNAGVKIILLVRGACIVRPGIKGLSENIKIFSIVGRFLEHSRIYLFGKGDRETIFIGSSDLMHRNLNIRNELLLLIKDKEIKERIKKHIKTYLKDTVNRREILDDYAYKNIKRKKSEDKINCHDEFIKEAQRRDI